MDITTTKDTPSAPPKIRGAKRLEPMAFLGLIGISFAVGHFWVSHRLAMMMMLLPAAALAVWLWRRAVRADNRVQFAETLA